MTGHPPGRVTVASACRSPWQARSAAAPGGRRSIRCGYTGQPGDGAMPRPAPNPRRYMAIVARQRRPADAVRGVADRGPRRWGVGEELVCAVQVGRGPQCAGSGQGRHRGRPGRAPRSTPSSPRATAAGTSPVRRSLISRSGSPAQTGCGTPSQRPGDPRSASSIPRAIRLIRQAESRLPQEFKHGRPPWLHPHRVRTRGSEMAMILRWATLRVRPIVQRTEPDEQITRDPLGRAALPRPRRSSCSRVITSPVASALLALGPNGICLRIAVYTADHDRPTTRDRRRLRVTRQGRGRDAAAVQVAVLGGSICDSEPSGPRDAP